MSATPIATSATLAERIARLAVEEMHLCDVDPDRHVLGDLELHVRRVLRDEVRPCCNDTLAVHHLLLFLLMLAFAHRSRVDPEVDDRLAPEGLDELDLCIE